MLRKISSMGRRKGGCRASLLFAATMLTSCWTACAGQLQLTARAAAHPIAIDGETSDQDYIEAMWSRRFEVLEPEDPNVNGLYLAADKKFTDAAAQSADSGETGVVPAVENAFFYEFSEISLARDGVGDIEVCELSLLRARLEADVVEHPVVERSVVLKFDGAQGVGYALDGVLYRMRVVVEQIGRAHV